MVLAPNSREELCRSLAEAERTGTRIERANLQGICALIEHKPEDMTATVEAGMTVHAFQKQLSRARQWLPVDPPNAEALTIGDLLAYNLSGPRRFGYGTIRDYLIGIKVALASGEIIKAGGRVVKNVAGYDLCKLFIGAKHSLGIIVEGTFKLRPLHEMEMVLETSFDSVTSLDRAARALLESRAEPVLLDAHNLCGRLTLVMAFAGSREDVEYQMEIAQKIAPFIESSTAYDQTFASRISVLPSNVADALGRLDGARFIARYGNGVIYYGDERPKQADTPNPGLIDRVKNAYDPRGILPK